jgi:hypothetical protein
MKIYNTVLLVILIKFIMAGLLLGQSAKWTRIETPIKDNLFNPQTISMRSDYSLVQMAKGGNYISYDKGLSWLFIPYQNFNITEDILSADISSNNQLLISTFTELVLTDFNGNAPKQILKNTLYWGPGNLIEQYTFTSNGMAYLYYNVKEVYVSYPSDTYIRTRNISISLDGNHTFLSTYTIDVQNILSPFKFHVTKSGKTFFQAMNKFLYLDLADTTWKDSNILPFEVGKLSDIYVNGSYMCLKDSQSYFYASSDEGISWRRSASPSIKCEGLLFCRDNRIFAKKDSGLVYSADYGNNWKYINNTNGSIEKIFGDSKDSIIAVTTKGMYLLTELYPASATGKTKLVSPADNSIMPTQSIKLFWNKTNNAEYYEVMTGNKYFEKIYSFHKIITDTTLTIPVRSDTIYWKVRAVSGEVPGEWSDTWRYIVNGTVGIKSQSDVAKEFHLFQNYPNPFNSSTTIYYYIPEQLFVNLTIYDFPGRTTAVLVNELQKEGTYSIVWAPKNVSSGIYYFRLKAGNFEAMRKITFLK